MQRLYRTMTSLIAMVIVPLCLTLRRLRPCCCHWSSGRISPMRSRRRRYSSSAAAISQSRRNHALSHPQRRRKTGLLLVSNAVGLAGGTVVLGFLLIPRFGLMARPGHAESSRWSSLFSKPAWRPCDSASPVPPGARGDHRGLGGRGTVAPSPSPRWGAKSLLIAVPAAVITYLGRPATLAVLGMVAPDLNDKVLEHAPESMKPAARLVLKLVRRPREAGPSRIDPTPAWRRISRSVVPDESAGFVLDPSRPSLMHVRPRRVMWQWRPRSDIAGWGVREHADG